MSELSLGGGHLQYSPQAVLGSGSETRPLVLRVGSQHPTLQQVGQDPSGKELSHIYNLESAVSPEQGAGRPPRHPNTSSCWLEVTSSDWIQTQQKDSMVGISSIVELNLGTPTLVLFCNQEFKLKR